MLPDVQFCKGKNIYSFNQSLSYPMKLGIAKSTGGACLGLAFHWMKMHSLGDYISFPNTILRPSTIKIVDNIQANPLYFEHVLRSLKLSIRISAIITENIMEKVSQKLATSPHRYELVCFYNGPTGHAVVLAHTRPGVLFFDPNYGCASFPCRTNFIQWFIDYYWMINGGPGTPSPCVSFKIYSFN